MFGVKKLFALSLATIICMLCSLSTTQAALKATKVTLINDTTAVAVVRIGSEFERPTDITLKPGQRLTTKIDAFEAVRLCLLSLCTLEKVPVEFGASSVYIVGPGEHAEFHVTDFINGYRI